MMIARCLENVRLRNPLVFCLTNFVTVNDCANMLLAAGASPVMSLDPREAADFAAAASAVVINIGSPSKEAEEAMLAAGEAANAHHIPLLLDPVGAGATPLRNELLAKLLTQLQFQAIRGNASEIRALAGEKFDGRGVDAAKAGDLDATLACAMRVARRYHTVVGVSGETDLVTDGTDSYRGHNGHCRMPRVTGSGCMLSALCGAFLGANCGGDLPALTSGFVTMGVAGELAAERLLPFEGSGTYRNRLIDAVDLLDSETLEKMARYEKI